MFRRTLLLAVFSLVAAPTSAFAFDAFARGEIDRSAAQFQMQRQYLIASVTERERMTRASEVNNDRPLRGAKTNAGGPRKIYVAKPVKAEPLRFHPSARVGGIVGRIGRGADRASSFSRIFSPSAGSPASFNFHGLSQGGPSFNFGLGR